MHFFNYFIYFSRSLYLCSDYFNYFFNKFNYFVKFIIYVVICLLLFGG